VRRELPRNFNIERARYAQKIIASKVIEDDELPKVIRKVTGVDIGYKDDIAIAAAVTVDSESLKEIESSTFMFKVRFPYIPTLLAFREVYPSWMALKKLKGNYDLVMVDGNGRLHPYRAGFACHLGVIINKPTIGVAKRLLCGKIGRWKGNIAPIYLDNSENIIGVAVKTLKRANPIYVSIGHKISLKTAIKFVLTYRRKKAKLPEPIRLAHEKANEVVKRLKANE